MIRTRDFVVLACITVGALDSLWEIWTRRLAARSAPSLVRFPAGGIRSAKCGGIEVKDIEARIEKLLVEAAECDLIANLSDDKKKQALFTHLASQYRDMVGHLQSAIANDGWSVKSG